MFNANKKRILIKDDNCETTNLTIMQYKVNKHRKRYLYYLLLIIQKNYYETTYIVSKRLKF